MALLKGIVTHHYTGVIVHGSHLNNLGQSNYQVIKKGID